MCNKDDRKNYQPPVEEITTITVLFRPAEEYWRTWHSLLPRCYDFQRLCGSWRPHCRRLQQGIVVLRLIIFCGDFAYQTPLIMDGYYSPVLQYMLWLHDGQGRVKDFKGRAQPQRVGVKMWRGQHFKRGIQAFRTKQKMPQIGQRLEETVGKNQKRGLRVLPLC